jgi:hypothetical protein
MSMDNISCSLLAGFSSRQLNILLAVYHLDELQPKTWSVSFFQSGCPSIPWSNIAFSENSFNVVISPSVRDNIARPDRKIPLTPSLIANAVFSNKMLLVFANNMYFEIHLHLTKLVTSDRPISNSSNFKSRSTLVIPMELASQ